jgi:hypothetical protein
MKLEIVVVKDLPGFHDVLVLFLDESVNSGALEIVSQNMELILRFYSIVEIFSNVYVFLCRWLLASLVWSNLDLIGSQDFAKSSRIVMEERFAKVIEILGSKVQKHLELPFFYFFEDIFVVKGFVKLRFSFASRNVSPVSWTDKRLHKILIAATVESSKSFKLFREYYFHWKFCFLIIYLFLENSEWVLKC